MNIIMLLWWSLARDNPVVPSRWQATSALVAASVREPDDQAFVDAISWFGDEGDDEDGE